MGYTTEFEGSIAISPPLSPEEIAFLTKFSGTRRMRRTEGPYFTDGAGFMGQGRQENILDYNSPPEGQPSLWCKWEPTKDGAALEWNGGEKFYDSVKWMSYLVEHFLGSAPIAAGELPFLTGHALAGVIEAQGEDPDDHYLILVDNDEVKAIDADEISGHEKVLVERLRAA
jgi:hypothetical protein